MNRKLYQYYRSLVALYHLTIIIPIIILITIITASNYRSVQSFIHHQHHVILVTCYHVSHPPTNIIRHHHHHLIKHPNDSTIADTLIALDYHNHCIISTGSSLLVLGLPTRAIQLLLRGSMQLLLLRHATGTAFTCNNNI